MTVTAQAPRISDQTLGRLLKWGSALFVVLLVAFAVFYTLSQRVSTGPSVLERQISAAESAVQTSPKNLPARLALAQAYRASGRTDDALAQYSEVLRVDKANMDALLGRGQTSLEAGKLDQAAADFNAIIKASTGGEFARVDQRVGAAHFFLATVQVKKGNPSAAVAEAQAALAVNSTDSDALYLLGTALAAQNKHADAVGAYLRALMFVPSGWCEPYEGLQRVVDQARQVRDGDVRPGHDPVLPGRPRRGDRDAPGPHLRAQRRPTRWLASASSPRWPPTTREPSAGTARRWPRTPRTSTRWPASPASVSQPDSKSSTTTTK